MLLLVLASLAVGVLAADPVVQLNSGGQLGGKEITYKSQQLQLFLSVPYAQAPIGQNRFAKPKPFPAWKGLRPAKTAGNFCPQFNNPFGVASVMGDEDCLFLDITVPGVIDPSAKKPVMVWIHGGGYISGSKNQYLGAALAVKGDVIVVAINYRLGVLGFLSDGNFGLWDQRQALIWVQDNIERFGGDPNLVTISGGSAGAGCVSAQTMGQHNDGLFKRSIQESGSLHTPWTWHLSERQRYDFLQKVRTDFNCLSTETTYECLRKASVEDLLTKAVGPSYFRPAPDGDFFASNITEEKYQLSKRFDMLAGFNGQDGLLAFAAAGDLLISNMTLDAARQFIKNMICVTTTPLSVELCVDYLVDAYKLDLVPNGTQRVIEMSYMTTDLSFSLDMMHQLSVHSQGSRSTYAYYFTEYTPNRPRFRNFPEWLRQSADHADEVVFVFGGQTFEVEDLWTAYYGEGWEKVQAFRLSASSFNVAGISNALSELMMTAWTNFARTGNPNLPTPLPNGEPEWPQFNRDTNQFIELNSANTQVITTPNKERVKEVYDAISPARRQQVLVDVAPGGSCESENEPEPDDGNFATRRETSLAAGLLVVFFHLSLSSSFSD